MPQYAEIIFQTGSKSIISYESEDELKSCIAEIARRVREGEPGAPQEQYGRNDISPADFAQMPSLDRMRDRPAEPVHQVLLYGDSHPVDLHPTGVDVSTLHQLIDGMADAKGIVDHEQVIRALRDEVSPVYPSTQGRLESIYKANATGELDLSFLDRPTSPNGDA